MKRVKVISRTLVDCNGITQIWEDKMDCGHTIKYPWWDDSRKPYYAARVCNQCNPEVIIKRKPGRPSAGFPPDDEVLRIVRQSKKLRDAAWDLRVSIPTLRKHLALIEQRQQQSEINTCNQDQ